MFDGSDQGIRSRLEELEDLDTVTDFCRSFYGLMADLLISLEPEETVRLALAGLLEVELRYHQQLRQLAERDALSIDDLQAAGERHRIGLESVREFAGRLEEPEVLGGALRSLVIAECSYHLGRTDEVVEALEQATEIGLEHPLVQFALGYNRYALALETCTHPTGRDDEVVLHDPAGFQLLCLRAVAALEEGLSGGELDAQLYWWMGAVLTAAGLTEAARDAYDRSASAGEGPEGLDLFDEAQHTAITEDEIRMAGELFKGSFDPSDVLGLDGERS
ncbi:MAG: hypothetical protein ABFE07_16160 [Armatimonadia bacterium]